MRGSSGRIAVLLATTWAEKQTNQWRFCRFSMYGVSMSKNASVVSHLGPLPMLLYIHDLTKICLCLWLSFAASKLDLHVACDRTTMADMVLKRTATQRDDQIFKQPFSLFTSNHRVLKCLQTTTNIKRARLGVVRLRCVVPLIDILVLEGFAGCQIFQHDPKNSLAAQNVDTNDDADFDDGSIEALGRKKPHRPRLPSRDTVQKLIDAVGIAAAAAQLGVDIATLQQYMNGN
ncbi:hypothetical protein F5051DRAFT_393378 [Lentinula edodes]|nr:hypothetical protein F5051DRAFT_393378 [Lentinula edodes]